MLPDTSSCKIFPVRERKALSLDITLPDSHPIKSPITSVRDKRSAITIGERGLRREGFIDSSQKKGFYYLIGKNEIVC